MANDLTFTQISDILNSIVSQATGRAPLAINTTADFVTVAQTALKCDYDVLIKSISQTMTRTIFSTRPYYRKLDSLRVSQQRFGNATRKLGVIDSDWENDVRFELKDGESVDMYKVKNAQILQTNFYGSNVFERMMTVYRDQLEHAFTSPEDLAQFFAMRMENVMNQIEQAHENLARATVGNFIAGKTLGDPKSVIHLLTEYNAASGQTLTKEDIYKPENFKAFMQWTFARVATVSELMTERTDLFQINVTGKTITRHTPHPRQRMYMFAPTLFQTDATVLANTFNDNYLRFGAHETVNFWQSVQSPDAINIIPSYTDNTGSVVTPEAPVQIQNVFGVLFDEEAMGYTVVNQWSSTTPFNSKGGYSNTYWHFTDRYWNDFTEKGVVLMLD